MRHLLLLTLLLLALHAHAQPLVVGSITHNGIQRDHRLYVPASYTAGTPAPLVFNLHGYTSNNAQQEFYGDFRPIADTAGFILVHPNGTLDGTGNRFWNAFGSSTVDDLGYLMALLDTLRTQYNIDTDRVYSTGMSNGGFMSHDLACFRSSRITAIASVTGSMTTLRMNSCAAVHPTPVMQIHGTADPTVPFAGGNGSVSVDALMQHWASFNNCAATPTINPVPNTNLADGSTVEHHVWPNGANGSTVELFKVLGGGHTWPGAPINTGVTNRDINASIEIWRFFSRYRLSTLSTGVSEQERLAFSVGPNPSTDRFHLRFDGPADRTIRIFDATGRLLMDLRTSAPEVVLEPDATGLLTLQVTEGGRRNSMRVLRTL